MRLPTTGFPALVLSLLLAACAGPREATAPGPAYVRVDNQSILQMHVYVESGGQRVRLGTVNAKGVETFEIPEGVVGIGRDVSFVADPVGSTQTASSFGYFVRPGDEVRLTIPPSVR